MLICEYAEYIKKIKLERMINLKKLFSLLTVLCLLSSLVTINASAAVEGTMEGWEASEASPISLVEDEVNGETRTVLKWNYGNGVESGDTHTSMSDIAYSLGTLPAGTYRISLLINTPYNPGGAWYGFTNDSNGGFPDNSKSSDYANRGKDEYNLVSRDVVVTNPVNQQLRIAADWGDSMYLYLAEAKVQPVLEDGSLGENIIENYNFQIKTEPEIPVEGTMEGWEASEASPISLVEDEVNGETRTVLKWNYGNGVESGDAHTSMSGIAYSLGTLPAGTYRLSLLINTPYNPGGAWYGLTNDSNGGFPDNSKSSDYAARYKDEYNLVSRDVVVTNPVNQQLRIAADWGDSMFLYLAEAKVQPVLEDGSLGENIIKNGDFQVKTEAAFSDEYWSFNDCTGHSFLTEYVNNKWARVLKVGYKNGDGSRIDACVGVLEPGTYKVSAYVKSPANAGEREFGLIGNTERFLIPISSSYELVTKEVTVTQHQSLDYVRFRTGYGDNSNMYITDVQCRRIYDDGTLGENRVINPEFKENSLIESDYQEEYTVSKGWTPQGNYAKNSNFTIRETTAADGSTTKALTAYKAAGQTGLMLMGQSFPTKANATYKVTFDAKRIGAALYVGTRMASSETGDFYTNLQQIGTGASDWATYSFDYKMGTSDVASNALYFSVEQQCANFHQIIYFDNVSVCEVLSDGSLGENLIYNGDFEAPVRNVTNAYFDIVDLNGDSMTEGEGYNSIPPFALEDGKLVAITSVFNNERKAYTVDFVVAVYKGGKLYHVDIVPVTAAHGETVKGQWQLGLPKTLGEGDVSAKAFVWDSAAGMTPLTGISSIEEATE